nr:urease accessory protein UreD [Oceaniglobus trochenteri]
MSAKTGPRGTCLAGLRQSGSLKCLFPRADPPNMQAVLVNTAGGITGGDAFSIDLRAEAGTDLTVTTQAAERAYRAQPGQVGQMHSRVCLEEGARLNWLPQETILFDGCALNRTLTVDLAAGASLLLTEPLVFGRTSMGEVLRRGQFSDRIEICSRGRPLYLDRIALEGDIAAHLSRPGVAAGARAMATLVYLADDAAAHLDAVRALLPETAGASLIRDGLMAIRILAPDSFVLRQSLVPVLNRLNGGTLPRTWMI